MKIASNNCDQSPWKLEQASYEEELIRTQWLICCVQNRTEVTTEICAELLKYKHHPPDSYIDKCILMARLYIQVTETISLNSTYLPDSQLNRKYWLPASWMSYFHGIDIETYCIVRWIRWTVYISVLFHLFIFFTLA